MTRYETNFQQTGGRGGAPAGEFFEKHHRLKMPFEFIQIPANGQGTAMSRRGPNRPPSCLARVSTNEPTAGVPGASSAADAALKAPGAPIL